GNPRAIPRAPVANRHPRRTVPTEHYTGSASFTTPQREPLTCRSASFLPISSTGLVGDWRGLGMKGYVAKKGSRYYAVIYEGLDPITGRERRRWHPAGACETEARALATRLAMARAGDRPQRSSLTVAVYLTQRWLPSKQLTLRASTFDGYRR